MLIKRRLYTTIIALLALCTTAFAQTGSFSGPVRYVTTSGNYANDGTSWAQAKNNLQDAIESLHDYMTRNGITEGRVYVAAGTYRPTTSTPGGDGVLYTSFLIYEGITVYGGFDAANPEATPEERIVFDADGSERTISQATGLKWRMKNTTTLSGNHSSSTEDPMKWNSLKNEYDESFTGNSYHVVWFATNTSTHSSGLNDKNRGVALAHTAGLDGFTIRDGNASNRTVPEQTDGSHAYHNSYGGGVYMVGNTVMRNCIIRQNSSSLRGGGVYMDGGGLMEQCYVTQNQSGGVGVTDGYGGGVACDDGGIVRHCLIENNAARCGGGLSIAFSSQPANDNARYASFATGCVVNNNTSSAEAGGVFMKNGGLLNHLTITYNKCVGAGVVYNNRRYGRSGGLYVDGGGMVTNSVIWGNEVAANNNVQYATYREHASTPKVKLDFVALSKYNYVDWSGTVKRTNGVYSLNEENSNTSTPGYYPDFTDVPGSAGVIDNTTATGRWNPRASSYLRHQGMQLNDYPTSGNYDTNGNDIVAAHITEDIIGNQFAPRCVLGAFVANSLNGASASVASIEDNTTPIRTVFIDPTTDAVVSLDNDATLGSSWENAFSNINDALDYVKTLKPMADSPVQILVKQGTATTAGNSYLPHIRSSFIDLPSHVRLYGGFASSLTNIDISKRNPKAYPTRITANITGSDYAENGCHIITVRHGATDVIVDGLQLYFANAQTSSVLPTLALEGGAGIAVINSYDNLPMNDIKIRNCIVANCTASQGSALFLRNTPGAVMQVDVENCIFHNNAVTRQQAATVEATGSNATLTLNHCLIRGNVGYGVMATDNANIKVKNTALHANINYGSNSGSSNLKITDLTATESNPDPNVVTFTTSSGKIELSDGATKANNMMDLGVSDAVAIAVATSKFSYHSSYTSTYPKFVNPTSNIGVNKEGDVTMYGGDPNWMPMNTNPMVNAANETGSSATDSNFGKDMTTVFFRNYGGAADIGAVENHNEVTEGDTSNEDVEGGYQPPYGKVIYVRDYRNADGTIDYSRDGDGSSWQNAINGNLESDKYTNNHNFSGVDAELYEEGYQLTGLQWAVDEAFARSLERNADNLIKYTEIPGVTHFNPGSQSTVNPNRTTIDVSTVDKSKRVQVWIGEGEYIRREGFFMRDAVDVYGGFPGKGGDPQSPGMKERVPKTSILETLTNGEVTETGVTGTGAWGPQVDDYKNNLGLYKNQISNFEPVDRTNWRIKSFSSEEVNGEGSNGRVEQAIDNSTSTYWHTIKKGTNQQHITLDLSSSQSFNAVKLYARNYKIKNILIEYCDNSPVTDYDLWTDNKKQFSYTMSNENPCYCFMGEAATARYVRINIINTYSNSYTDLKEIYLGTGTSSSDFSPLDRTQWTVEEFSTEETNGEGTTGRAAHAIDGDENTYWHTAWKDPSLPTLPQYITIDMRQEYSISQMKLISRSYKPNSITIDYSSDYSSWNTISGLTVDNELESLTDFGSTISARYIKLTVNSVYGDGKYFDPKDIQFGNNGIFVKGVSGGYTYDLNAYQMAYKTQRVLTQPYPYFKGKGNINGSTQGNNLEFDNNPINPFCVITSWDGFVIRNGRTKITHQRDGGAGVALRINGRLANCVITNNILSSKSNTRGGGIFQNGGIIENCEIDGNILNGEGGSDNNVFGGGLYQRTGTVFNTSVIHNKITGNGTRQGTGVFFENGRFYNNTITANEGPYTLYSGKWFSNGRIDVYNSIIYNNTTNNTKEFDCNTGEGNITLKNCLFKNKTTHRTFDNSYTNVDASSFVYMDDKSLSVSDLFNDPDNGDYSLKEGAIAINMGTDQLGKNMEGTADIVLPSYDAQYADRIQDCTVDIGAYEFNGAYSITPDETTSTDKAVFYVTQNGRGTGSAANPENAACWTKLQKVLDAAGRYLYSHKGDVVKKQVIVKLAGDAPTESVESGNKTYKYSGFVYRPRRSNKVTASGQEVNTRDYTIIVPHGVEVWGGYSDAYTSADDNGFYTKDSEGNYTDNRDVLKNRTTLSGVYQADDQDVNVYNVVTFTNDTYTEEGTLKTQDALKNISARAVLDGLFIEDGNADGEKQSTGQRTDTRVGGAAIVTGYAHIRNCVVQNNKATDAGGGLYLEEGALVSGSIVQYNEVTKGDGGGLYVEEPASASSENVNAATNPARIFTSDIIYNTASGAGGGISFTTDGTPNVRANSVLFWQNTGSEQSNVNGMVTPSDAGNTNLTIDDYPISFCATETTREPGINNIAVHTDVDKGVRFATETYNHDYTDSEGKAVNRMHNSYEFYNIKKYSLLARGGMEYKDYKALVESDALTAEDMANVTRTFQGNDFIDIGARAIGELVLPVATAGNLMTRIFVVKNEEDVATTSVEVMQNQTVSPYYQQEGSSFAYPMRYLDDALEYVRDARKLKKLNDAQTDSVYAYKNQEFEIILSGGTYYPMRNIKGEYVNSRGRTYLVPEGVTIVGGVEVKQTSTSDGESYYGNIASVGNLQESNVASTTFTHGNSTVVISHPEIKDIINSRKLSDINHNNIAEPWEMAVQTILSGQVVNGNSNENVYHVIACIADEKHVGGLPDATITYHDSKSEKYDSNAGNGTVPWERGVPVIIDGVEIEDGMAIGYDATAVNSKSTYYKGGAICVEGNWTTGDFLRTYTDGSGNAIERPVGYRSIPIEVRNCNFRNNGGCLGGAIFTDSELKVFACNFVQNYAKVETDKVNGTNVTYAGRGGAINASYNTVIVNSLFANNEADTNYPNDGGDLTGLGGAVLLGEYASLHMINCDVVRNLAYGYPAVYCYSANKGGDTTNPDLVKNNPHKIVNTIFWGNEVTGDSGMDKVANFAQDLNSSTKNAEMLWFCAYEAGKGNAPVNSNKNIDYRLQDYTGFGTFIPSLWTGKYNYLDADNTTIKESTEDNPDKDPGTGLNPVTCNIIIDSDNDAINGPNFINPSSKAGKAGYYTSADWMIGRINNLVDNGWTFLQQDLKGDDPKFVYIDDEGNTVSQSTSGAKAAGAGIYRRTAYDYDNVNTGETAVPIGKDEYMTYADGTGKAMLRISTDPNPTHHQTYIDLGVYEYQHVKLDPSVEDGHIDVLWVTQQERTSASVADGKTWATATSDVQRAIETLLASRNGHDKEIRMLEGRYQPVYTINGNLGFTITTDITTGVVPPDWSGSTSKGVNSLTIRGGYSKDVQGLENIHDYPVYLFASERSGVDGNLLGHVFVIGDVRQRESSGSSTDNKVTTNVKDYVVPVYLDGLTFCNIKSKPHKDIAGNSCSGGAAVFYKDQKIDDNTFVGKSYVTENGENVSDNGVEYTQYPISGTESKYPLYKLTMNRCDFLINGATSEVPAVTIGEGGGEALIYNSVFHSNTGSPLVGTDTKVVNCTFALNGGSIQFSNTEQGKSEMHNSVLWRNNGYETTDEWTGLSSGSMTYNAISSLSPEYEVNNNVTLSSDNNNVLQGPNFFDPALSAADDDNWAKASRDFRVNPSAKIIGKASPKKYVELVKDLTGRYPYTSDVAISNANDVNDPYYVDLVKQDFDLAANTRHYGSAGMERGAYECIATLSRVLYVNPERVSSSADYNGFSWEKAYTKGNLQKAIDAAAVYSNVHNKEKSYVFVKGMATSTGETITMRDNVTLYGSLPSTTGINTGVVETTHDDGSKSYDDDKIIDYIKAMDSDRDGMASSYSKHTIVNGVKSTEDLDYCLFDGLLIGNADNGDANSSASPVVDIQKGNVALRNSIIANNEITSTNQPLVNMKSGLLYNTLIRDNKVAETSDALVSLEANGYMLNCTVVGGDLAQVTPASNAINNIMYKETDAAMPFAPYFRHSSTAYHGKIPEADVSNRNLWYQLHERTTNIEGGDNGTSKDAAGKYDGKSHVSENLKQYVDYTSDRDLLGNPRFLGTRVDKGCFETWSTGAMTESGTVDPNDLFVDADPDNYNRQNYPHEGSVVYLQPAGKLVCKNITDGAGNVTSHYFTDDNPLRPGYVLSLEGGSLYGQGNTIHLRYVSAERTIEGQYSLFSLPFDMDYGTDDKGVMPFVTTTTYDSNNNVTEKAVAPFSRYEYDGEARSHYKYSFAESNSTCWKQLTTATRTANEGMLIDRGSTATKQTLRFTAYGATAADYPYRESADEDYVTLTQYDDRTSTGGGSDFTSVYNMGWNLKGMPYLISAYPISKQMEDGSYAMNVPHVIYTMEPKGSYVTKRSWESDNTLSPGDAFFTQTATINDVEKLQFAQLFYTSSATPNTASTRSALNIYLSYADATSEDASRSVGVSHAAGVVSLQPVDNTSDEYASLVYSINRDGAKFMSMNPAIPDIAVCGAGGEMMSLVGAAPVEKEISLATRVGSTGRYTFSLDRSAGVSPATTEVWLKDYQTGIVTNLMEEAYTAEITAGETPASPVLTTGRFSLTIGGVRPDIGERDENSARWTISINHCRVSVSGLSTDSDVLFYTTDGILRHRATPFLGKCEAELSPGVYVVRAEGNSKVIGLVRRDK
ncbi:discoidin domain-containing protein [Prevotella sp. P5-92]|uniref:galactose-binding domain-containing protein n=1 Tax=Prevotella sp. P5-92 TaxID=2024222 RepID=UPI0013030472|nr:discoidin domain-containing protein [Prevotella sp. P5-92]